MKQFFTIILLFLGVAGYSQQTFDEGIEQLAQSIAYDIDKKGDVKIAVWQFVNTKNEVTNLGKYVMEEFSVKLTKAGNKFLVMDRNHLEQLLNEHQLNSDGYIDPTTAKSLGKMINVDYIITGTTAIFDDDIKVRVKVLDTETAFQMTADDALLPIDENIASFLGVPGMSGGTKRGFNGVPVSNSDNYNNPEKVSSDCETLNIGDYCFQNNTNKTLIIELKEPFGGGYYSTSKTMTVAPGANTCLYNYKSGVYSFEVKYKAGMNGPATKYQSFMKSDFRVEACKSLTKQLGRAPKQTSKKSEENKHEENEVVQASKTESDKYEFLLKVLNFDPADRTVYAIAEDGATKSLSIQMLNGKGFFELSKGKYILLLKDNFTGKQLNRKTINLKKNRTISIRNKNLSKTDHIEQIIYPLAETAKKYVD